MSYFAQIPADKKFTRNVILLFLLPALAVGVAYWVAKSGGVSPYILVAAVIALAVAVFTVMFPEFGLYMSIVVPFFIFDVIRLFNTEAAIGSAIDVMVLLTFLGVVLKMRVRGEPFWKNCQHPIVYLHVIVQLYYVVEFFNPNGGTLEAYFAIFKRNLAIFLYLYCAIQLFKDVKVMKRFFVVWLLLTFGAGVYACYEEWVGMPKFELDYILADPLREALSSLDNGNYRKSSFLSGCTDFALCMSGTIIIVLTFFLRLKTSYKRRLFLLSSAIIMTIGMSYSGTRTATFMLTMEVGLYALMTFTERRTIIFSGIFAVLFVFIMFGPIYGNPTINRLKTTFQVSTDESLKVRDVNRHRIQPYIYEHPIGGGIGTTGVLNYHHNIGHPLAGFPTDSGFLNVVLEQGWVGLLLVCLNWFVILRQGVRSFYRSSNSLYRTIYLAATTCLFGFVFAQYAQVAIGQVPNGFLFVALVAMIIRLGQIEKAESGTERKQLI
jgi:putative inorganic carbon (hco3(-)) transporter